MLILLLIYVLSAGMLTYERWQGYEHTRQERAQSQANDRQSWEDNPDKHPHRMAHFGAFAFRPQHPLSVFDAGLESFVGNVIFLEAHKQNTANFSEASLSTGLIRFGDLHLALLLNLILPLFVFFIGHNALTQERALRTLKLMYIQGASLRDVILGKGLGLFMGASLFFVPAFLPLSALVMLDTPEMHQETLVRILLLISFYILFFIVICLFTVLVSAWSKSSSQSLLTLLGVWLLLFVVAPKTVQAVGTAVYPHVSKLDFRRAIEADISQLGDSHNPDDPYFKRVKDSLLRVYDVDSVSKLPFNYGGYIMGLSEQMTADVYAKHQEQLIETYRQQNQLNRWFALINPYLAIQGLSMSLSGTDFETYDSFLHQAERYRYELAKHMADLQMHLIDPQHRGSTEGRKHVVSHEEFKRFHAFHYAYPSVSRMLWHQRLAIVALLGCLLFLGMGVRYAPRLFTIH